MADPSITVAFSPHAGSTDAVVQLISEARRSIHLAAYGFTSELIAQALVAAHQRGVAVEAVLDKSTATARFTKAAELAQSGVLVRIDYHYAIMHDKFIVVDGVTVETGSFNYTAAAERHNAENVLILREPALPVRIADHRHRIVLRPIHVSEAVPQRHRYAQAAEEVVEYV